MPPSPSLACALTCSLFANAGSHAQGFGFMSLRESGLGWYFLADFFTLMPMPYPFIHFTLEVADIFHEVSACWATLAGARVRQGSEQGDRSTEVLRGRLRTGPGERCSGLPGCRAASQNAHLG